MKYSQKLDPVICKHFICGKLIPSTSDNKFKVINPATEEVIGEASNGSLEDVNTAVEAAKKAFCGEWRTKVNDAERGMMMFRLADLLEKNASWLAYFQTLNNGKPYSVSLQDIAGVVATYRYFAGQADKIKGNTLMMTKPFFGMTKKQPIGVVAQIIPWNYPLLMMAWKVAPALAAGCTIILKPAEQTPYTALMLGELFNQAGFPPGVINIVTGEGETGACLAQHKLVSKVSFTGSTEVGYLVMRNSHKENLKPITLELGGKSANIIFPDADIDEAVKQACILFSNGGQSCVAGSRTFVHESIHEAFVERAIKVAEAIRVGDPMREDTDQGPQISKEQFDKIMFYIGSGEKDGAKIVTGGKRVGNVGFFIQPTIFVGVEDNMLIAREQIFGPVMSILKWKDEQEVIQRANSLPYGLGAGIFTNDVNKVLYMTDKLHAGTVYVNCYDYQEGSTPFGGVKDSGIGKDLGDEGLQGYLYTKTIIMHPSKK